MNTKNEFGAKITADLFDSGKLSDVTFILKQKDGTDRRIPAHKMILAPASPVFMSMFYGDLKEEGDVTITDATAEGFTEFLEMFYKPEVNLTAENITEVVRLIDKYDVSGSYKTVEMFLRTNVSIENVCIFYEWANAFQLSDELVKQFKTMIGRKSKRALRSAGFKQVKEETVVDIFKWDCLSCDEKTVCDAAVVWAMNAPKRSDSSSSEVNVNIKAELSEIINHIRFHRMTFDEFHDVLSKHPDLLASDVSEDIINFIKTGKAGENSRIAGRSVESLTISRNGLLTTSDVYQSRSSIVFNTEINIKRISVHRLEFDWSMGDELFESVICIFFNVSGSVNSDDVVAITFDDLLYDPLKKTYICELKTPLRFAPRNKEFYLYVDHPHFRKVIPSNKINITKTFNGSVQVNNINEKEIERSHNLSVVKIDFKIE